MPVSEKERLAAEVAKRYSAFEEALFGDKRKYPLQEFKEFWEVGRRYAELTRSDPLIHRKVIEVVHGLRDIVGVGRKRIPDQVPWGAERLECLCTQRVRSPFRGRRAATAVEGGLAGAQISENPTFRPPSRRFGGGSDAGTPEFHAFPGRHRFPL